MIPEATTAVLIEVGAERARQITERGYTPEDDQRLERADWSYLLLRRITDLFGPEDDMSDDPRRLLLEVAAIAVAGVEAHDRAVSTE
jgi:hypothetical protein